MGIASGRGNCIFEIGDLKKEMVGKKEEKSRTLSPTLRIHYSVLVGCDSHLEALVHTTPAVNISKRMRVENSTLYCTFPHIEPATGTLRSGQSQASEPINGLFINTC